MTILSARRVNTIYGLSSGGGIARRRGTSALAVTLSRHPRQRTVRCAADDISNISAGDFDIDQRQPVARDEGWPLTPVAH